MKGILLTGGLGTRLYPITRVVNKHLLPVFDRPMFYWPLQMMIDSGIRDIAIVSGPPTGDQVKKAIEFFPHKKNIKLTFVTQKEPLGMPHAILLAKKFIGKDSCMVSVGDNIFGENFRNEVSTFTRGAAAIIRKVKDPSCFGVAVFKGKEITDIVEKPKNFVGNFAVGAPYFFDNSAFQKIETLKLSKRGELEIVELLKLYLSDGDLNLIKKKDLWIDTGTPENLLRAGNIARKLVKRA